jgi:hypothetical protein
LIFLSESNDMAERDYLVIRASDDFDPSAVLRTGPSATPSTLLRAGITVTATDGSAEFTVSEVELLTTGRPGGVAAAEEEKAV